MTGQADGHEAVDAAAPDYAGETAENAIIDAIRARPVQEREWIVARAIDEFPAPARISWSDLVWALVVAVATAWVVAGPIGEDLSTRSRGFVMGVGALLMLEYLAGFVGTVWGLVRARRRGDAA